MSFHQENATTLGVIAVFVLVMLAGSPARSEVFMGLDVGAGDLDIDNVSVAPDFELFSVSDTATTYQVLAGYEFDNGFHVVGGFEEMDSIEFFGLGDQVELEALKLGVGFSTPASKHFRAGGTVGVASWDLEARESILFNPGPEATGGLDDTDVYFDIGVEWVINETFRVPLTFSYNDYDFGDATTWRIGIRIHMQ